MNEPARAASVRGGNYSLDLDPESGSFARFEQGRDKQSERAIASALAEADGEGPAPLEGVEEFEASASSVTGSIEQGKNLLEAALAGRLLEPHVLDSEIASLLDLFERLDRSGRYEEQLRLARVLHGLLALGLRWYELVRSLRAALRAAIRIGDQRTQAWVLHELGSLHLCAGQAKTAAEHFGEALKVEQALGDSVGSCASRHNLECARRDLSRVGPGRRLLRLAGLVAVFLLLGGGGTAIAVVISDGVGGSPTATTTSPTPSEPITTTPSELITTTPSEPITTTPSEPITTTPSEPITTTPTPTTETRELVVTFVNDVEGDSITGPGITCPDDCREPLQVGTTETLTASRAATWTPTGTCKESSLASETCTFVITDDVTVTAVFRVG